MVLTRQEKGAAHAGRPPGGELLRRYWHPIAVAKELSAENPPNSSASWVRTWCSSGPERPGGA